jgi:hypothetical protein
MSLPSSASPLVPAQKQPTNIYTMMLILSLIAVITATVLLAMELDRFKPHPWWNAPPAPNVQ